MIDLKFANLAAVLASQTHEVVGQKLRVADKPTPFVPPVFLIDDSAALSKSEVILIRASAAVGKTTLARALSAERGIPILDLAKVPVATGSLVGILNDFKGSTPAIQAFHGGTIPLLVDALDEGRLNSGDNGLFSFIETSADLILQDRSRKTPKLVMLGRPEAISYAELYFLDKGVSIATLDVGFFDEASARQLVHAYADAEAKPDSLYHVHREPADRLVSAYFAKIGSALGFTSSELWSQPAGRSFAGYAPVLAAIGSLLPRIENFAEAQNRLEEAGTNSPWGVIESVLDSITIREQHKVCDQLLQAGVRAASSNLYSSAEQAALLLQFVQRLPLSGTGRLRLSAPDTAKYTDQVQRFLPEHPFLKNSSFSNDVIASYVMAVAIVNGWVINDHEMLRRLARQPFLWRSLKSTFADDVLIDGEYLGYILSSFWSDPLTSDDSVMVDDLYKNEGSYVEITLRGEATKFNAAAPLHFYSQLRNVRINTLEAISLIGAGDGSNRVFSFSGLNKISSKAIELRANEMRIRSGSTWLDAEVSASAGQFKLVIQEDAQYGWSEKISSTYPFSMYPSTISNNTGDLDDELVQMLSDCAARSHTGTSITLLDDYSVAENDYLRSVFFRHGQKFITLISCLVDQDYATTGPI